MKTNSIKAAVLTTIAAAVMATSFSAPASAAGPANMNLANMTFQSGEAEIMLVGGRHKGKRFRHGRHYGGHGHWGHGHYYNPYYGGCFWRKKRFWDGHGYYYRKIRVCG